MSRELDPRDSNRAQAIVDGDGACSAREDGEGAIVIARVHRPGHIGPIVVAATILPDTVAAVDRARASDDPPVAASPEARSGAGPQPQPAAAPSPPAASGQRQAFRVAVEPSADDRSFVVRVLGEGEAAPGYAYEALLVPLEAGAQLLRGRK